MRKSKHYSNNKNKSKISNKRQNKYSMLIPIFIIILIALGGIYISYKLYFQSNSDNIEVTSSQDTQDNLGSSTEIQTENKAELQKMANEMVPISSTFKVKNAEYLEFMKLTVNTDKFNFSTIHSDISNTSASAYNNLNLRIFLYDDNKNIITHLDCKLNNIKANNTKSTLATLKRNLNNCSYYSVTLIS